MFAPWVGHYYPHFGPEQMVELSLTQYISLYDSIRDQLNGDGDGD